MEREKLGSRLGFILLSAGCAIGIGNVWKFPYVAGQNGGAIFILIYLFFLAIIGIPVMTMEFAAGRNAQKSPAKLHEKIRQKKTKWKYHGYLSMLGNYLLMAFYTTVAGWMLRYFLEAAAGTFQILSAEGIVSHFDTMLNQPLAMVAFMGIVVASGFIVCGIGLQKGLENVTKVMMGILLGAMVILAINSIFLPGASEGLKYYLLPNWENFMSIGPAKVIAAAMNQAFFTLSLGIGGMAIFGSYIDKKHSLMGESIRVALLDTFVAIVAGLIIIPACFAYDVEITAGPSLIFITLPNVFNGMPFGRIWAAMFFMFMTFAAFSTVFAVFENIISCSIDLFGWNRKKACIYNCIFMFIISLPCALGFNVLSSIQPLGEGSTILDLLDCIVSQFLLPMGSMAFVLFCTWSFGWGWKKFCQEANTGTGSKVPGWMYGYSKYVLPLIIVCVFVLGLYGFQ